MDLREKQAPLKERYRSEPDAARITLTARGSEGDEAVACSVDLGRAIQEAQAHVGVGGPGTAACSGDLLLGALAACAQVTCQMVAESMGLETESINVTVEGDLDLRGTLGSQRSQRGLRRDPRELRRRRTRCQRGRPRLAHRENRALLHGPANPPHSPADRNHSVGSARPRPSRAELQLMPLCGTNS